MTGDRRFLLLGGIAFLLLGVASLLVGETFNTLRVSRHRFVDRSDEPVKFWFLVVFYFLAGLVLCGLYFARFSN